MSASATVDLSPCEELKVDPQSDSKQPLADTFDTQLTDKPQEVQVGSVVEEVDAATIAWRRTVAGAVATALFVLATVICIAESATAKGLNFRSVCHAVLYAACPCGCAVAFLLAVRYKSRWLAAIPPLLRGPLAYGATVSSALPLHLKTFVGVLELGRLLERSVTATGDAMADILRQAGEIVGRPMTVEELNSIPAAVAAQDARKGLASRISSFFTFVNFIWFVSIVGLTALAIPFLAVVLGPLAQLFSGFWSSAILPFLSYTRAVYEPLFYLVAIYTFVESLRYPTNDPHSMSGTMIAVTSVAMSTLCRVYSFFIHHNGGMVGMLEFFLFSGTSFVLCCAAAVAHQSALLGYAATSSAFCLLQFSPWGASIGRMLGLYSYSSIWMIDGPLSISCACAGVSLLYVAARWIARGRSIDALLDAPFRSAVHVFGTTLYFFCLMLFTFDPRHPWMSHSLLLCSLAMYFFVGWYLRFPSLTHAAKMWSIGYAFALYCNYCPKNGDMLVVFWFLLFLAVFFACWFLNRHPQYVRAFVM